MRSSVALQGSTAITSPRAIAGKRGANARVAPVVPRAAAIDAVTFDGAKSSAAATLELKTARAEVARGLVHKYVVMVRQNARRVRTRARRRAQNGMRAQTAKP